MTTTRPDPMLDPMLDPMRGSTRDPTSDTTPGAPLLTLDDVAVRRGGRMLLEGLTLTLAGGDGLRLTGPNGAGKTSLLRVLAGLLAPARGRIDWGGAPEAGVHLLSHLDAIKPSLRVEAWLRGWRHVQGGRAARFEGGEERTLEAALRAVGLARLTQARCGDLSAGQRRRLALARVLVSPRPVWLLDEPTAALDAAGQALLEGILADHRRAGGAVIAATHLPLALPGARTLRLEPADGADPVPAASSA